MPHCNANNALGPVHFCPRKRTKTGSRWAAAGSKPRGVEQHTSCAADHQQSRPAAAPALPQGYSGTTHLLLLLQLLHAPQSSWAPAHTTSAAPQQLPHLATTQTCRWQPAAAAAATPRGASLPLPSAQLPPGKQAGCTHPSRCCWCMQGRVGITPLHTLASPQLLLRCTLQRRPQPQHWLQLQTGPACTGVSAAKAAVARTCRLPPPLPPQLLVPLLFRLAALLPGCPPPPTPG
jgi:hypothetical protein